MNWDQVWASIKSFLQQLWGQARTLFEAAVKAVAEALEAGARFFLEELAKAIAKLAAA